MSSPSPPIAPAQLAALPPEFQRLLRSVIDHYEERCAKLEAHIAELEAELKLAKTPQNCVLVQREMDFATVVVSE